MGLWQKTTIQSIQMWNEHLASFKLDLTLDAMKPGQYLNLGLLSEEGKRIKRSYSMASPLSESVELFIVRVEGGAFTSQLFNLQVGDEISGIDLLYTSISLSESEILYEPDMASSSLNEQVSQTCPRIFGKYHPIIIVKIAAPM